MRMTIIDFRAHLKLNVDLCGKKIHLTTKEHKVIRKGTQRKRESTNIYVNIIEWKMTENFF
jgi:hypothetical protein